PFPLFARPNINDFASGRHAGSFEWWDPDKGYKVLANDEGAYKNNFPTMGADGLYFDILDPPVQDLSQLTWSPVEYDGIKVTAHWTRPDQRDNWIKDKRQFALRVWLNGPRARDYSNPGEIHKPNLPHTFVLEGKDASGRVMVKYGFELRQWFVHRGGGDRGLRDHTAWCKSFGYRLVRARDLTNAISEAPEVAKPYSPWVKYYQRRIGGGFFSEWGHLVDYADVGFGTGHHYEYCYWTSDYNYEHNVVTCQHTGRSFLDGYENWGYLGLCVTP
ncbi:hypothetical protein, partial [Gilliamella sp. Bim1-2]